MDEEYLEFFGIAVSLILLIAGVVMLIAAIVSLAGHENFFFAAFNAFVALGFGVGSIIWMRKWPAIKKGIQINE